MKTMLLKPVDATWLMLETADTPMHIGVLAIFHKPRNAAPGYLGKMAARMREFKVNSEPWNMRLSSEGITGVLPRMVEARDIELNYHFQHSALPAPGGERELGIVVSRLHSPALDRNRPLWELHLIEGLERDRFAFYLKIHHALVSFLDSVPTMLSILSDSARSRNMPPLWTRPLPSGDAGNEDAVTGALASLASLGKAGAGLLRASISPDNARGYLWPSGAPRSTLNRAINQQRRFATQQFERARIERIAKATSCTENEILTYLCGSSLRRFFKEYNALPDESLVGLIPVPLREKGSRNASNAVAAIRVELGTQIGDPLARLEAVKASIQTVRNDRAALPEEAVTPYALLRAAPLFASQLPAVGRFVPPVFNLKISNTEGTDTPMYFDGARLDAIYPISQLLQYAALSIDCVSYAGTLNIGFTGAHDTLPHLQRLAVYLGKALAELEDIVQAAEEAA